MADTLRAQVLATLEKHDGVCLDNQSERERLAATLAATIGGKQFLVVRSEGGRIADAVLSPSLYKAEQVARKFLATADMATDDAAVLRVISGQVDIVTTSKVLLADADL